jgi:hypothetical protein
MVSAPLDARDELELVSDFKVKQGQGGKVKKFVDK